MSRSLADSIAIQNPSFENLTVNDPAHFDSSGTLLPRHASIGLNISHGSNAFETSDPVPGWKSSGGAAGTDNFSGTPSFTTAATVPEHSTWLLATLGLLGLAVVGYRGGRKKK